MPSESHPLYFERDVMGMGKQWHFHVFRTSLHYQLKDLRSEKRNNFFRSKNGLGLEKKIKIVKAFSYHHFFLRFLSDNCF